MEALPCTKEVFMDQVNEKKLEQKANVIGAWILAAVVIVIPLLIKFLFFSNEG